MMIFFPIRRKDGRKNQYIVVAKNGARLEIVYHSYFADKTGFLEDLFRQKKAPRALRGCRIRGVAYTLLEIQLPYRILRP